MKKTLALLAAASVLSAPAADFISEDFSSGIPYTFTVENRDGVSLRKEVYNLNRIGGDRTTWFAGQMPGGRWAMSPTYNIDGSAAENILTLPPADIVSGTILRWDARSLHKYIPETYHVSVTKADGTSTVVYRCEGESHCAATHALSLDAFAGEKDVRISFTATTERGFILGIDNVRVGVPERPELVFTGASASIVAIGETSPALKGTVTNYGAPLSDCVLEMSVASNSDAYTLPTTVELPDLAFGESAEVEFALDAEDIADKMVQYTVSANGADYAATIHDSFIYGTRFPRLNVIDRCSGTWCNNCLRMELTTTRLEDRYGPSLIVLETHVNDMLSNQTYWDDYLSDFCRDIPKLVPNHSTEFQKSNVGIKDYLTDYLCQPTRAAVSVEASYAGNNEIRVTSKVIASTDLSDNSTDRYRMGYMLLANYHNATNPGYMQSLSTSSYLDGQFYYMPSNVLPEMMYFENVPIETSTATNGVPRSLPESMSTTTEMQHSYSIAIPANFDGYALRVLAVLVDTQSGTIINAAVTDVNDWSGIADIAADRVDDNSCYDITGRPVANPTSGFYIKNHKKIYIP